MSPSEAWPDFSSETGRFFSVHLARPRSLLDAFTAKGAGSGRRGGPRTLYWQTVIAFSVAALEAGLEDLLFAAHGIRQASEGLSLTSCQQKLGGDLKRWLVEDRLMAPQRRKVDRVVFADFGVLLDQLPPSARFTVRFKNWSLGGSGRGTPKAGPSDWVELGKFIDTLTYIRNAVAHADATKLGRYPQECEGSLWLKLNKGGWSVQQPHALTALRVSLAAFNTVADGLARRLGCDVSSLLTSPDEIDFPPT
jgi:hypothetical protein